MPVSVSYGGVLEFCYSPEGGEEVLHSGVQAGEGLPRSHLPQHNHQTSARELGIEAREMEAAIVEVQRLGVTYVV